MTTRTLATRPTAARRATPIQKEALKPRPLSLTTQAYALIEEMIVKLELQPGAAVSEAELSARLGIGRTPVREALQRLAREHLVLILPQRGVLVSEIDIKRQLRLLETRREVERLVVRSAARRATEPERARFQALADEFSAAGRADSEVRFIRADKEFNDLSLKAARNEFTTGAMGLMHGLSRRFWFLHYRQADDLPLMAKLHSDLARAVSMRDEEKAANALDTLLDQIERFTKATVSTDY